MHQKPEYNLVDEPWIPILRADGTPAHVGLAEIFNQSEGIADLAVRPHERVALMRLLLCLCYASEDGIFKKESLAASVGDYLKKWKDSFWLYHPERPFLQIASLRSAKENTLIPLSKLDFALSAGHSSTLFDHVGQNAQMSSAKLALLLLTCQCFSPGGLISQVYWHGRLTSKTSFDAPCITGSMLHVFVRGKNLGETLILNIAPVKMLKRIYGSIGEGWLGRPCWECFPQNLDDQKAVANATKTFMGRLVPLSRAIRLEEKGMLYGEGLSYPSFQSGFPAEPTATVYLTNKGKKEVKTLLAIRPDKAVWRELPALLAASRQTFGNAEIQGPVALGILTAQAESDWEYELIAAGMARDKASILDTMESVYPLRRSMLSDLGQQDYLAGVTHAEGMSRRLAAAIDSFRKCLDGSWESNVNRAKDKHKLLEKLHRQASLAYWNGIEQRLGLLFDMASAETQEAFLPLEAEWKKFLFQEAVHAYDLVCGELSGRHEQAYIRGRSKLTKTITSEVDPA